MVDFAELNRRHYESLDEAGRARVDAYRAAEAAANETLESIDAVFKTFLRNSAEPLKTETRQVKLRIEQRGEGEEVREILAFKEAVTGYENYTLDENFVRFLREAIAEGGRFCICAGTAGVYDNCTVSASDVLEYVSQHRPELVAAVPEPRVP